MRVCELQVWRKALGAVFFLCLLILVPLAHSQGSLTITVNVNKSQYVQGDTVTVSGTVVDSQNKPVNGASVSIQVGDPPAYATTVVTESSGTYTASFVLPQSLGPGQVTVYATGSMGTSTAQAQTQFTVVQITSSMSSSTSTGTPSTSNSKCFIATATYGSEISPEVALLRHFRDAEVVRTSAGSAFMIAFNIFYYNFSPQVALVISSNQALRTVMKVLLYPLIGILYVSDDMFQALSYNGEIAVVLAGMVASFGIGAVYFAPMVLMGRRILGSKAGLRVNLRWLTLASCTGSIAGIIIGEVGKSSTLLTAASVATVLSFMCLGASSTPRFLTLARNRKSVGT